MDRTRKKYGFIFLIILSILFPCLGSLLLYRAYLPIEHMIPINGKLEQIHIKRIEGSRNSYDSYALLFKIDTHHELIGFHHGNKVQAQNQKKYLPLKRGLHYTFYIDPTVGNTIENYNLGLRIIKEENVLIFQEKNAANVFGGVFFLVLSTISISVTYIFKSKSKKNKAIA